MATFLERVAIADNNGAEALLVADVNPGPRNSILTVNYGRAFSVLAVIALIARYSCQIRLARRKGIPAREPQPRRPSAESAG